MKVKINQLEPNPYRDMNNYPISEEKVKTLVDSIQQTGFWDNILARKQGSKYQIAYGHHRLAAIREVMKPTDEVDIPVKELTDALMLKIMANENMDDWKATPQVIDETVRVTKQFLEDHPEEYKKVTPTGGNLDKIGFKTISSFLGWPESRVSHSLERLKMIDDDKVEHSTFTELPTERAARNFVDVVKKYDIPKERQKAVIDRYKEKGGGEIGMRDAAMEEMFVPKTRVSNSDKNIKQFDAEFASVDAIAEDLRMAISRLSRICDDIGVPEYWNGINWTMRVKETLKKTSTDIERFINQI
jgi:hypothetical protein